MTSPGQITQDKRITATSNDSSKASVLEGSGNWHHLDGLAPCIRGVVNDVASQPLDFWILDMSRTG